MFSAGFAQPSHARRYRTACGGHGWGAAAENRERAPLRMSARYTCLQQHSCDKDTNSDALHRGRPDDGK